MGPLTRAALAALLLAGLTAPADAQQAPPMRYIPAHSGNYTARSSRTIDRIVIHTIEGSEAGAISWFRNSRSNVSAHYVVSHAGRVTRMLRDSDVGWHCRTWNYRAIGIECEGYANRNTWTDVQMRTLAQLTAYLCARYSIPVDRTHLVGHVEVPGNTHTDPGRYFDWSRFITLVRQYRGGAGAPAGGSTSSGSTHNGSNGTYTVQRGDTLSGIAQRFGVSLSALVQANGITDPSRIYPGQRLVIPGRSATRAPRGPGEVEVTASRLNVRAGAWGTALGTVGRGDRFAATGDRSGDWVEIYWQGRTAWVHDGYLRAISGPTLTIATGALNVRSGPSTGYRRIGQVVNGQRYYRWLSSGAWRKVQYDDRTAWVHGSYTR